MKPAINKSGGDIDEREHLAQYLLGELAESEELQLEQEFFTSDEAFEKLLVVEDELAYDYMEGRLTSTQRARFESTVGATVRGRKNLDLAAALLDALKASRAARRPIRYWAAGIAAAMALIAVPVWLAWHVAGLTRQLDTLRAEAAARETRLAQDLATARAAPAVTALEAAFLLTPGLARSEGGPTRLEIPRQTDILRLELVPPPGVASGDVVVTISHAGGNPVWSRSATASGRTWAITVPAPLLPDGEYTIAARRLAAGEQAPDLAGYAFRVVRR